MRMTHLGSIIFGVDGYFKNIHWHLFLFFKCKKAREPL